MMLSENNVINVEEVSSVFSGERDGDRVDDVEVKLSNDDATKVSVVD